MKKFLFVFCALCFSTMSVYASELKPYVAARASYSFMNNDANQWVDDRGYTSTIVNEKQKS